MSDQKDKYFQRQHNRFIKGSSRKEIFLSSEVKNSLSQSSESKPESVTQSLAIKPTEVASQEKTPFSLASSAQDNLKRLIACSKTDFESLIRDKILRQDLKKEQRRLTKVRNDNKLTVETDTELSITAINGIISLAEEYINDVNKQKAEKIVPKTTLRANQEKEIAKQLKTIDEQIQLNNFAAVKSTIQILLKKYGKDELLQQKLAYLNFMLALYDQYERESSLLKDISSYIEKLSSIDTTPENINPSSLTLKNLKKQVTIALNKENKKQEPNERTITLISQVDKIGNLLTSLVDSKTEKKGIQQKSKRQLQLEKELQQKSKSSQFLEESVRFFRDLLEKSAESKQELYKQLQNLKKNKKKSSEIPYSMVLKVYESIVSQKRQQNEINLYLKACSQLFIRKNLNLENLSIQIKKLDQKYIANQTLNVIKPSLDVLVTNIQQRERSSKEVPNIELQLKKVKTQNLRLEKLIQEKSKTTQTPVEVDKVDKKKELQEKRARDAERLKQEKQQKEIQRSLDNIFNNLQEKKWKMAKNAINLFTKKYQESTSLIASKSLQSLTIISNLMQDTQNAENRASQIEKREKASVGNLEKEKQALNQKIRSSQEYESIIKNLLESFNQENFSVKKYFDDLRKDRKKIVQQRYQLINRLQEPLTYRQSKLHENSEKVSFSLSASSLDIQLEKVKKDREQLSGILKEEKQKSVQLENKLKQSSKNAEINKDAQQLLNLVKRIEKGGQWWKFLPKIGKASIFKPIYSILEKYRENQLTIQSLQMFMVNEELLKQESNSLSQALDSCLVIIQSNDFIFENNWDKQFSNIKANTNIEKIILCLRQLGRKAKAKIQQQRNNYKNQIASYEQEIQNLSNAINDLQKKKDSHTERSSSKLEESSSRKSPQLKSSRRSSKSKEKDRQGQVKQIIQEYVQQQRKMLSKIQELQGEKVNLELKATAIENELIRTERLLEDQRIDFENSRFAIQKIRLQQHERISQLQGELQISEGRRMELQTRLETEITSFAELQKELTSKLHYFQQKQLQHQESLKNNQRQINTEEENPLTSQLNYYRQMCGQLAKQLQNSKQREQNILKDFEILQQKAQFQEKRHQSDLAVQQQTVQQQLQDKDLENKMSPPLKMKPYKVNIDSQKVVDLYLDTELVRKQNRKKKQAQVKVQQKSAEQNKSQVTILKLQIERLTNQLRNAEIHKVQEIEREVLIALKNQQLDFNEFLKRFQAEKFQFFMTQILPKRLEDQLSLRNLQKTSNYEFMHNEWILNQFPRLYEERHNRQCPSANIDIEAVVESRLNTEKQKILQQKRIEWEEETKQRIEQGVIEFQQNTIPLIIQQYRIGWEQNKAQELEAKIWQVDQYWRKVLEQQKNQQISQSVQAPSEFKFKEDSKLQQSRRQYSGLQLLELMRKEENKLILETLIRQQQDLWEQKKAKEWEIHRSEIQSYWETVVIPEKQRQWQTQQEIETQRRKITWIEENNRQWNQRLNEVIIPQKIKQFQETKKTAILPVATVQNPIDIIENWKLANLPFIIEAERKYAIDKFIQIDLPLILQDEKKIWLSLQQAPDVTKIISEQYKKWELEKQKQISFITSAFDAKLSQILQLEHVEWQKQKNLQLQRVLVEERTRSAANAPNIQQILDAQHRNWDLMKLEQIRRIQLEFETRLNEIQRKLNSQIIDYQEKFLKQQSRIVEVENAAVMRWKTSQLPLILAKERDTAIVEFKNRELPKIIEEKYKDWESVDLIQLLHTDRNKYIIENIVNQKSLEWQKEREIQRSTFEAKILEMRQFYEKQLINQREQHQAQKKAITFNISKNETKQTEELRQLQRKTQLEIETKIKQVEDYWQTVVIPQRQDVWRRQQVVIVDELLKNRISQVEAAYHDQFIPKIIDEERKKWDVEIKKKFERQKEQWLIDLPTLLKTGKYSHYIQPFLDTQASHYELQIKKIQAQSSSSHTRIQQLMNQVAEYESKLRENRTKYQIAESRVNSLLSQHDLTVKKSIEQSQKLNEELTRSRWAEKEVEELRKIIEMQKIEVSKLTATIRETEKYKLENINLQQVNNSLQKAKWQQINEIRSSYEAKILQMVSERNNLQSKISQLEIGRKEGSEKEAIQSLQRQISILTSTIKTKDAQITFLKKTIETVNTQLRENREKFNEQLEKRAISERTLAEMRSSKLELDYEIKYLKDRQESLTKKIQLKDQQMLSLRKKIELDSDSIEKKLKSSLEYASSYQVKFAEIQTLLTIKTKESQTLMVDLDRVRYENQSLTANVQNLGADVEQLKRQIREVQAQKTHIMLERDRNIDEVNRLKQTIIFNEEELKRSSEVITRLTNQISNQKIRFENQLQKYRQEILQLQLDIKDIDRIKRIQTERAERLEKELSEVGQQTEIGEIEVLKKINRDVTDLTTTNRQLQMKCLLLENREKITSSSSETINSFLLIQKHTDQLLDFLLKEDIVPNLELYHKFVAQSRNSLSAGRTQQYFVLWEKLLRDLFNLTISCRADEIRIQAEELLRLRDQMTDVLQRQIEVSQGDQNQIIEDYKQALSEIKDLVRQYMKSGDEEYLRHLCTSLKITI